MHEKELLALAGIIVLGVGAQWAAWRLRLPSILLLLCTGFVAGPVTGHLDPDALLGRLLFPIVSISVAVILFEGGLSLRLRELQRGGAVIRNLTSIGALVCWVLSTLAAHLVLGLSWPIALLFGAVLIVTGPTVIQPLLRHVRPSPPVGTILKWEGIVIDPVGATVAVLVFEAISAGGLRAAVSGAVLGIVRTAAVGAAVGIAGAALVVLLLRRRWVPDFLDNPMTLLVVVSALAAANHLQPESGLLAVTVLGVALANQRFVPVRHIVEFKENLRVLLISGLFIVLAARIEPAQVGAVAWRGLAFVGLLVLIVRPASVAVSTLGSGLRWQERVFLAWMAPRGIVAAAVASVFALELTRRGRTEAEVLVPLTFLVIVVTVAVYGLTARPLARLLGVAKANPQGVLIVGGHPGSRAIGRALHEAGFDVLVVDTNPAHVSAARMEGLRAWYGSILGKHAADEIDFDGLGRLLAMTPNGEVNSLAAIHMSELFGRGEVYQLPPPREERARLEGTPAHLRGRLLFGDEVTFERLADRFARGAVVKRTQLTSEFTWDDYRRLYGEDAIPLFVVDGERLHVVLAGEPALEPREGQAVIALVDPADGEARARMASSGVEGASAPGAEAGSGEA